MRADYFSLIAKKEGHDPTQARHQFMTALAHLPRLFAESKDNRAAVASCCEMFRTRRGRDSPFRADMNIFVEVSLSYLGLMHTTSDNERIQNKVHLLELKHRQEHFGVGRLVDMLRLAWGASLTGLLDRACPRPHKNGGDRRRGLSRCFGARVL